MLRLLTAALLVTLGLAAAPSSAQSVEVTGTVTDSTEAPLPGATVVLLQASDSLIVSFGASRPDGAFRIPRVGAGSYLLQVTYVGYLAATQPLTVASENVDVGRIQLAENTAGLDSLVVTADRVPLIMREDTLDFDAGAFGTPLGSSVEDLLRRLPGVEVDRDGSIKAQGEDVSKVLVDGKEFFGNDPKTATRNLPADAVERVQIFDKASETAEFTGVEDGNEERTINLALKEDRKVGWLGNVGGGLGGSSVPPGGGMGEGVRYDGKVSLNRFSPNTQLSFLGNANNLNRQNFEFQDVIQFSGGPGAFRGGGVIGAVGGFGGQNAGFSSTFSGGVNLNHDFGSKTELRSSYFGSGVSAERSQDVRQQQVFGSGLATTIDELNTSDSESRSHALNLDLKHEFAEGHDLRLRTNARTNGSDARSQSLRETRGPDGTLEADRLTTSASDSRSTTATSSLVYRKRLGARSVVAQVEGTAGAPTGDRSLLSEDQAGVPPSLPPIDQLQTETGGSLAGSGSLLFTQPLGTARALQLDLRHAVEAEDQDRVVLDRIANAIDPALSSAFDRTTRTTTAGLTLRDNRDTRQIRVGADLQRNQLDGELVDLDTTVARRDWNVLPSASIEYTFPREQRLMLNYSTSVNLPSLRQLQPVADNRDPLNVYVGNPALRPEYQHALSANFFHFDSFSLTNLFAFVSASYTPTAISTDRTIDERFRQVQTPINTGDAWRFSGSASYGTPIRPIRTKVSLRLGGSYSNQTERLNGLDNDSDLTQTTARLAVENQRKTHVDVQAGARLAYNTATYSLNPDFDRSYLTQSYFAEASKEFGEDWSVQAEFELERTPADVFGSARSLPLLSAEVTRRIGDHVRVELVGQDLLDQGLDITYASTGSLRQEQRARSLGRYVMLRLVYTLTSVGGGGVPPPPPPGR